MAAVCYSDTAGGAVIVAALNAYLRYSEVDNDQTVNCFIYCSLQQVMTCLLISHC